MFQLLPKIALAPLFVVWFGVNIVSRLSFAGFISFFPIVLATFAGLRATDAPVLNLCRAMRASPAQIFWQVRLPYAVPLIMSGLKVWHHPGDHWRDRQRVCHGAERPRLHHRVRFLKSADRPDVRGPGLGIADRPDVLRRRSAARTHHSDAAGCPGDCRIIAPGGGPLHDRKTAICAASANLWFFPST